MKRCIPIVVGLIIGWSLLAADSRIPVFLDPAQAGADYAEQGEYTNDWGGVQIVALGDNTFQMTIYKGGLPGAGWDKATRNMVKGRRNETKIAFEGENDFKAELIGGQLAISPAGAGPYFMHKTQRSSPALGAKPPAGALVLFDGKSADEWAGGRIDPRGWLVSGCKSQRSFTNFTVHLEFMTPFKPLGRGQDRGNSGVYLQDRYEVQVLDSFGLTGENNECGGFYTQAKPAENMCFPPLVWQTYDIDFTTARFDDTGKKIAPATASVRHNGVLIHDRFELRGPTGGGKPEAPGGGPIQLQDHGNPVFYRNIWLVPK